MCKNSIIYSASNYDFRIAARFLHIRHRKQLLLPHDHPALQAITRSTFPSGFPLENQLHQTSNEEVLKTQTTNTPQPSVPSTADTSTAKQMGATSRLPHNESLPVSQGGATQFTVPEYQILSHNKHLPIQ